MAIWGTLLQRRVPPALLGRVAARLLRQHLLMPISMAMAGPVADAIVLRNTFYIAGTVPLVGRRDRHGVGKTAGRRDRPPPARRVSEPEPHSGSTIAFISKCMGSV
jgi:hypothetical protein